MLFRALTLLALVALAAGTWILSNQPRAPRSTGPAQQSQLPGYYLQGTVMTDYNQAGEAAVRIAAERIEQIDHGNDVQLHNVRMDYQTDDGQLWILVGDRAHVQDAGRIVDIDGHVQLQGLTQGRQGPAVVTTDHATYDVAASEVRTNSEVHMSFGKNSLSARGLLARLKERTVRLESKVYGRFIP